MSINTINYVKNKMIFNKILNENYTIKKELLDKNIILINSNGREIKCKCIMFLIEKDKKILWSDSNPYNDQYTKEISEIIRNTAGKERDELKNLINKMIKNQYNFIDKNGKSINCNWIITNKYNNITEYYMITDIIYY
jgi:hypothetical protein